MGRLFAIITTATVLLWAGRAPADVAKVGLLADFTGAFATWGFQFQEGVEAYQALHGKTVNGPDDKPHEIQFIYRDTASQGPDKATQLAQELVLRDHVRFLCGLDLSPHAMALADISKEAKVPVVIMNAATSSITRMSPYFVRVSQTVPQDVAPLGPWAVGLGIKRVYTIVSDYAPGYDAETYFTETFKAAGGTISGSRLVANATTSLRSGSGTSNVVGRRHRSSRLAISPKPNGRSRLRTGTMDGTRRAPRRPGLSPWGPTPIGSRDRVGPHRRAST